MSLLAHRRGLRHRSLGILALGIAGAFGDLFFCFGFMSSSCAGLFFPLMVISSAIAAAGSLGFLASFTAPTVSPWAAFRPPHVLYLLGPCLLFLLGSDLMPYPLPLAHDLREVCFAMIFGWPLIGFLIFVVRSHRG